MQPFHHRHFCWWNILKKLRIGYWLDARTACKWLRYVLPPIKNWWPFCSEHLQRLIMYQNDWIFKRTWLRPLPQCLAPLPQWFLMKFKENNENDMAAHAFWTVFYFSHRPSQIGPKADFDGAAIQPPIFSMIKRT